MTETAGLHVLGDALAHPSRARMLCALMQGRALTAKELAIDAGVAPSTASAHLARLCHAGLVRTLKSGRHSYFRIASATVARRIEELSTLTPQPQPPRASSAPRDLHFARSCYNHLAGALGVRITDALVARGALDQAGDQFIARPAPVWQALGVTLPPGTAEPGFARPCLDWSERRFHISGLAGRQMLDHTLAQGWLARRPSGRRGLDITTAGRAALIDILALELA